MMNKPDRAVVHIPAWLLTRYFVLAEELERMHGAAFAAAFLDDIGVVSDSCAHEGRRRLLVRKGGLFVRQRTDNADCV
jgi:hypothetical protein